jgi:polynucleotide 5'-hydroxyl-kinase GRC3/NOL9
MEESLRFDRLLDLVSKHAVTIFIGGNDTGKSTLIRQITGEIELYILDSDIGQSDIGPPATVSLGAKEGSRYRMVDGYFCGSVSPSGHLLQMLAGVSRMMCLWTATGKKLIVNTTGLVSGEYGRALKTEKINAIRPDLIIAIDTNGALKYLDAFAHAGVQVVHIKPMRGVHVKSKTERMEARKLSFRGHFEGATISQHSLEHTGIERSILNNGHVVGKAVLESIPGVEIIYAEVLDNEAFVVYDGQIKEPDEISEKLGVKTFYAYRPDDFQGVLMGLVDSTGRLSALGLLDSIDFREGVINVFSTARKFNIMQFGSMKLDIKDFGYCGTFRPEIFRHKH